MTRSRLHSLFFVALIAISFKMWSQPSSDFKVIAFFTAKNDRAHISFVHEANKWFEARSVEHHFQFDSTSDWTMLNESTLAQYQVVMFLDTRPEKPEQRRAFETYMSRGGAWMGFHFAAFALTPSAFPQNWDWYHNELLGVGEYKSNTWRPVPAVLRVESSQHDATRNLSPTFRSAACEWYRWKNDITKNPNFEVLLSIDPSSFPLGTGPKAHEIWHTGYYPIVWTNKKYNMIYFNMGHNDIDYADKTNRELSSTFSSSTQNQLFINALLWLGRASKIK